MSRYLSRLAKLEAAVPPLPALIEDRPQVDLHTIVEQAKAEADFLERATPLERVVFLREEITRLEARLAEATERTDNPLVETLRKVHKVWLPSFLENARTDVRQAELGLVREAGFNSLDQPGAREHLELELFAA